jgi:4-amino-4-deoxy-L-arabinose transferase-like glycosyltransferase
MQQTEIENDDKTVRLPRLPHKYSIEETDSTTTATLPARTEETVVLGEKGKIYSATLERNPHFLVRHADVLKHQRKLHRTDTDKTPTVFTSIPEQIEWLLDEKQHVIETHTRQLPTLDSMALAQTRAFPFSARLEALMVVVALAVSFVAHAFNMFNFPHYEQDEGTYMSSAWAIMHGMLQAYPYTYDHPPVGWIQITTWIQLTGGFFTFGNALNSGRVLMVLYAVGCSLLVYLITRRLSGSSSISFLATIIFSLSPLSVIYQRQVFLDNIATFWLLLSFYLLIKGKSHLFYIVAAAVAFGLAILSKEVLLLFMPTMLYAAWLYTTPFQRRFSLIVFTYVIVSLGSGFLLLAVLKGELFPTGWLPWDSHQHLSLIGTLFSQVQRTQSQGDLLTSWNAWTQNDQLFIIVGGIATCVNLIGGWWNRKQLLIALVAISYWFLFVRGGVVFPYYIIPLLPLTAINIAMAINNVLQLQRKYAHANLIRLLLVCGIVIAILPYDIVHSASAFTQDPTAPQNETLAWLHDNVPHDSTLIINNYLYTDLHAEGGQAVTNGAIYPYANDYLNVAYDPQLHDVLLHNDWNHIDYIVADSDMLHDIKTLNGPMLLIDRALHHAILRKEFRANNNNQQYVMQIYQVIHTNTATPA